MTTATAAAAAAAARVTEPATAKATSVAVGAATESVYYAVGKWTVTTIKMALVAYACHMLVPTFSGFLMLIAALLFIKYGRPILDLARAVIYRLLFKPSTGHADLRARGTRADQHGERSLYMEDLARMPAKRDRENRLRLRH